MRIVEPIPISDEWRGRDLSKLSVRAQNIIRYYCATEKDVHRIFCFNPHIPNCGKKTLNEIRHTFGVVPRCPMCGQWVPK
jgi:hypothetical protein